MPAVFRPHAAGPARVLAAVFAAFVLLAAQPVQAGNQQYAPMSASVRTALAAAVADERSAPEPRFVSQEERDGWLTALSERLPRKWKPDQQQRIEFLKSVRYEAQRAGLDPHMVLGLIEVESYFRRYAVSHVGARGYMQVMPFWTRVIGDGDPSALFDLRTNLRYGCAILRHYIDIERGDLFRALGRYNGSLGRPEYPNAVLRAWRKWEQQAAARPAPARPATIQAQAGAAEG